MAAVASRGLVSPRVAADGVALFFLDKADDLFFSYRLWKVMTLFTCRLLTFPIFPHRLSTDLSKFSHTKNNFSRVSQVTPPPGP